MLCDKCLKRNATTHIKRIVNGKLTELSLCSECAASEGLLSNGGFSDLLSSLFGETHISDSSVLRCPVCGASFSDIAKNGKAGCPECYTTFKTELLPSLKRLHGNVMHIGKSPTAAENTSTPKDTLGSLKEELKRLIAEERFEEAAIIRDKIKEAENK